MTPAYVLFRDATLVAIFCCAAVALDNLTLSTYRHGLCKLIIFNLHLVLDDVKPNYKIKTLNRPGKLYSLILE